MKTAAETILNRIAHEEAKRIIFKDEATTKQLREMYIRCFMNTVETTVSRTDNGIFVITGDIPAMWLRDSSAQVLHYVRYAGEHKEVRELISSLLSRQFGCILQDPYANAYMENTSLRSQWENDMTDAAPIDWERKYETDSLCYPVWLLDKYITATNDLSILDRAVIKDGLIMILKVFETELDHENRSPYRFMRNSKRISNTLSRNGLGPVCGQTGLLWSGFRPSDDACEYSFHIPDNYFAASILKHIGHYFSDHYKDIRTSEKAASIRTSIENGLKLFGRVNDPILGEILPYETDGLGHYAMLDDANVPGLLGLPVIDALPADSLLYKNTRKFVLSSANPYHYSGTLASGLGSPHTPSGYVWHIGMITEALTEESRKRREEILSMIMNTTAGTGLMHEAFNPDNDKEFTRELFAWANSLFAYLVRDMFIDFTR